MQATFINEIEKGTNKTTVESLRLPMLQNYLVFVPPKHEQYDIVNTLDRLCTEIDSSIAEVQKKMKTLKLYREALITDVVTNGLRTGSVDTKIEWLGATPSHWKIKNCVI